MFGTVEYFIDYFKMCIMHNLIGNQPHSLFDYRQMLMKKIMLQSGLSEEKEVYLSNLEKAYNNINEELFGDWGKR
ncbi:hypothetical protein [Bacillus sp. FJAT-50079]|uniref:hypothetical protein n=1 Tax=Bacillus sp. FJAT-50079 TaxID=2833577 RepID=UPI001BCA4B64|nr:hypothetical protein [Bacillus sp. FJAT-50079]MBS4207284.1 hypothetical protein [Bacillus sp. FJAT-50079]